MNFAKTEPTNPLPKTGDDHMEKYNNTPRDDKALSDESATSKKRNWRKYKQQSVAVANAYRPFDELVRYAQRISYCGSALKFAVCPKDDYKRLLSAHFCKCRLCVMCQWRKSLEETDRGTGLIECKDINDLFKKLGI
jgi:plasmid rolling circle replication initiator protein Rep